MCCEPAKDRVIEGQSRAAHHYACPECKYSNCRSAEQTDEEEGEHRSVKAAHVPLDKAQEPEQRIARNAQAAAHSDASFSLRIRHSVCRWRATCMPGVT